jgi:hypothetical protein
MTMRAQNSRLRKSRAGIPVRRFTEEEDRIITNDYLAYVPMPEIAQRLERDEGTIRQRIFKYLGVRRSGRVTLALQWAPEELKARVLKMEPAKWLAACYAWRNEQRDKRKENAERMRAERMAKSQEIDAREDFSRNDKIRAKRIIGLTNREIANQYGVTRQRVQQIVDPNYVAASKARRQSRVSDKAARLFALWQLMSPQEQQRFRQMIAEEEQ